MPSPVRRRLEQGCRGVALVALAALIWQTWSVPPVSNRPLVTASTSRLPAALLRATRTPVAALDLTFDSLPGLRERAWARAIAGAGTRLRWRRAAAASDDASRTGGSAPLATAVEPLPDPSGQMRLVTVGTPGSALSVADGAGSVDSSALSATGARILHATLDGRIDVHAPGALAISARRDSLVLRPVLVIANAGWEGKFTVAALEEAGWRVDARFAVAPQVSVRQGSQESIDTAHYAAVVAVDQSAAPYAAQIVRFVRDGGGAVVGGAAASLATLAPILPARAAGVVSPTLGAVAGEQPRAGLDGIALTVSRNGALVLDRTGGRVRVVAARVGIARVLVLGYEDTWRWRMEGGAESPRLHREWWSAMVGSVAHAPAVALADAPTVDETPYASLVDALGAPADSSRAWSEAGAPIGGIWSEALLFALLVGGLVAEWGSRRLRGAR